MKIGKIISDYRCEKGMTQKELAAKTGLSRSYIGDIEKDRYTPSFKTIIKISNVLGLDINFFTANDGNTMNS